MQKGFRYRLYPTPAQRTAMQTSLDACRWVYNETLKVRRDAWSERKHLSLYDTNKMLTQWKKNRPWLKKAFSQCLQEAQQRVDLAFQHFFRRVHNGEKPGYPRFKGDWYKSFTYKQPWNGFRFTEDGRLYLSKIGNVRIRLHRPIDGEVKTLTIKRDSLGNWWASFSCEVKRHPLPPTHKVVGVDVGLTHLATLSTGEHIPNPRFFRRDAKDIAKAQRRLSQCKQGTSEYRKRKRVIQHIHKRIANRRQDYAHKLSRRLVNEFQIIALEDLNIQQIQHNNHHGMNKSIADAAWNQLQQYVSYKAESAGRTFVTVDPRGTTQICSSCGNVVPKNLSIRVHNCHHCGLILDRDHNAALNILALGMQSIRLDR